MVLQTIEKMDRQQASSTNSLSTKHEEYLTMQKKKLQFKDAQIKKNLGWIILRLLRIKIEQNKRW